MTESIDESECLGWDTDERDRLLSSGALTEPIVAVPVEVVVEADE